MNYKWRMRNFLKKFLFGFWNLSPTIEIFSIKLRIIFAKNSNCLSEASFWILENYEVKFYEKKYSQVGTFWLLFGDKKQHRVLFFNINFQNIFFRIFFFRLWNFFKKFFRIFTDFLYKSSFYRFYSVRNFLSIFF